LPSAQPQAKKKLNANFRRYKILGACNPPFAHQALQAEEYIGAMLPCNVIVQEKGKGVEIAAVDPVASMAEVKNTSLPALPSKCVENLRMSLKTFEENKYEQTNPDRPFE
jgi:uncharacterized protein (DUF302 family)